MKGALSMWLAVGWSLSLFVVAFLMTVAFATR